jgi:hypothetical protein
MNKLDSIYNFNSKDINGQSLIHLFGLYLPENSVGVELGLFYAQTSCMIAQKCDNVSKIYGIDPYTPGVNEIENISYGEKESDYARNLAMHNIKFSGVSDKIEIIEDTSINASHKFEDNSLNFIFWDCPTTYSAVLQDMAAWYRKLKTGGIMCGHDWDMIKDIILFFKQDINDNSKITVHDQVWAWIK